DNTLAETDTYVDGPEHSSVVYSFKDQDNNTRSWYDPAGNLMGYSFTVFKANGHDALYTGTDQYFYNYADTYLQAMHTVHNSPGGPEDGQTIDNYNADQQLVQYTDKQAHTNNRYFLNNAQGQVLTAVVGDHSTYADPNNPTAPNGAIDTHYGV